MKLKSKKQMYKYKFGGSTLLQFWLALVVVASLVGCAVVFRGGTQLTASGDRTSQVLAVAIGTGAWQRVDAYTLSFAGVINSATADEFLSLVNESTQKVIVNSAGGEVTAATKIGLELRRRKIELMVDGYCLSSCANYWAVSAPSVALVQGVIGFHGNLSSCIKFYGGMEGYLNKDFNSDTSADHRAVVRRSVEVALLAEREFYVELGREPLELVGYCSPDKGRGGGVLSFIAPSLSSLKMLGVNVTDGQQSLTRVTEFNVWSREPMLTE